MSKVLVAASLLACGIFTSTASPAQTAQRNEGDSEMPAKLPPGVTLRQIDGGAAYFASISPKSAWMDQRMLLGGWMLQPSQSQVAYDIAMGNNLYWNLAGDPSVTKDCGGFPCRADYLAIRAGGMHAIAPEGFDGANDKMDTGGRNPGLINGPETVGWAGRDEPDMTFGPGWGAWTGREAWGSCVGGQSVSCGYTVSRFLYTGDPGAGVGTYVPRYPIDGRVVVQTLGKGVLYWQSNAQAKEWLKYTDILAADEYWFTDADAQIPSQGGCALLPDDATACEGSGLMPQQARLAANYQYNINRLRTLQSLNGPSKPVVAAVETGCPGNNGLCTTPAQMTAAAWHSIIAGARGIIWFQHNFSGPCVNFNVFYDGSNPASSNYNCQQSPGVSLNKVVQAVTAANKAILSLSSVLLSPFADGYVTASGVVSVMAKYDAAANCFYVFAAAGRPGTPPPANQSVTFTLAGAPDAMVAVVNENRTLAAGDHGFTDSFADANAVHIYRIDTISR